MFLFFPLSLNCLHISITFMHREHKKNSFLLSVFRHFRQKKISSEIKTNHCLQMYGSAKHETEKIFLLSRRMPEKFNFLSNHILWAIL